MSTLKLSEHDIIPYEPKHSVDMDMDSNTITNTILFKKGNYAGMNHYLFHDNENVFLFNTENISNTTNTSEEVTLQRPGHHNAHTPTITPVSLYNDDQNSLSVSTLDSMPDELELEMLKYECNSTDENTNAYKITESTVSENETFL
eukprot:16029_1